MKIPDSMSRTWIGISGMDSGQGNGTAAHFKVQSAQHEDLIRRERKYPASDYNSFWRDVRYDSRL